MPETTGEGEDPQKKQKEHVQVSPPTPLSGAERFFLGPELAGFDVSASVLTEHFLQHHDSSNNSRERKKITGSFHTDSLREGSLGSTDDFVSAAEDHSDFYSIASNDNSFNSQNSFHRSHVYMERTDNTTMASKSSQSKNKKNVPTEKASKATKPPLPDVAPAPVTAPSDPSPTVIEDEQMKVAAAEIVYGKAKEIIAWGKSVPVVSLFVEIPEAVVGKALDMVGTDLSEVDGKIESELLKFDSGILNPAIETIVKIVIDVAGKSEDTIKPIIETLLKPLGFLIKSELNEVSPDAHTETPEVTVSK